MRVKPLGFWQIVGLLLLLLVAESYLWSLAGWLPLGGWWDLGIEIVSKGLLVWGLTLMIRERTETVPPGTAPPVRIFVAGLVAMIGFRFLYDTSIDRVMLLLFEVPAWLTEAFDDLLINPLAGFLSIVLVAPLFEEWIFRRIFLTGLKRRYGALTALVGSSLLFGFWHFNVHQGMNAFLIGLVIGGFYLMTGSFGLAVFMHLVNNALVMLLPFGYYELIEGPFLGAAGITFLLGGVLFLTAAATALYDRQKK